MKVLLIICVFTIGCVMMSCTQEQYDDHSQANEMFEQTLSLVKTYTDSLRTAPDTASVRRIAENYEAAAAKISLGYPPETDMKLTEGQQDSIWRYTRKFLEIKRSRLRHLVQQRCDTIQSDTLANDNVKKI